MTSGWWGWENKLLLIVEKSCTYIICKTVRTHFEGDKIWETIFSWKGESCNWFFPTFFHNQHWMTNPMIVSEESISNLKIYCNATNDSWNWKVLKKVSLERKGVILDLGFAYQMRLRLVHTKVIDNTYNDITFRLKEVQL